MAIRLEGDAACGYRTTDHSAEIDHALAHLARSDGDGDEALCRRLAVDLLQAHDETGLSLDDWPTARQFVERFIVVTVLPNLI